MAGLIDELMNTLEKEIEEYQQLLELSMQKTGIIIKGNIAELQEMVEKEQEIVERINLLEKKRIENTNDVAIVISRPAESLTLTRLTELMESQPEVKRRLQRIHDGLQDTLGRMARVNDMNKGLLQESLDLVNFDITLMNSLKQAPITANYDKSAYNTEVHLAGKASFDTKQ